MGDHDGRRSRGGDPASSARRPSRSGAAPGDRPGFGLTVATALIVGSIIGVGIFNLPTSLAVYGPISLVSMALTTVGALALAVLFAALSRRLPADGGPYAYARAAFGNALGVRERLVVLDHRLGGQRRDRGRLGAVRREFVNKGHNKLFSILLVLIGLWIPAAINLSGVKNMGSVQVVTTIIKFVALAFMSIVGLFFIKSANYTPWNVSGEGAIAAIGGGMAIALFSYLGVEAAAVAAAKVKDPDRNVPQGDDPRHARDRGRLHAVADASCSASCPTSHAREVDRAVLRRGQRDVRRHAGQAT